MDSPTTPRRQQRPAYPVLKNTPSSSSSTSSAFYSSSSFSSLSSQGSTMSPITPSRSQTTSAPLPSPDATTQPSHYFGSLNAQRFYQSQQYQPQQQPQQHQQQYQQYQQTPPAQQFGQLDLLAEAAKRAQVAVMMREFEACDLS